MVGFRPHPACERKHGSSARTRTLLSYSWLSTQTDNYSLSSTSLNVTRVGCLSDKLLVLGFQGVPLRRLQSSSKTSDLLPLLPTTKGISYARPEIVFVVVLPTNGRKENAKFWLHCIRVANVQSSLVGCFSLLYEASK